MVYFMVLQMVQGQDFIYPKECNQICSNCLLYVKLMLNSQQCLNKCALTGIHKKNPLLDIMRHPIYYPLILLQSPQIAHT